MNHQAFEKGRDALRTSDYKAAEREFSEVMKSTDEHHVLYNKVASYLGLAQVLTSDLNGLLLCRDAASSETQDGDVFLNLACAEWHSENRKRALDAILRGREIDSAHEQLVRACMLIDSHRLAVFPFLPREHILNRMGGRLMRRNPDEITVRSLLY
jgi:hypothetical protein